MMSESRGVKRSILSNAGGQIEWLVKVGDLITEDQVVCLVIPNHPEYHLVRSPYAGQVIDLVVANKLYVNANQIVAWVTQTEARSDQIKVSSKPTVTGSLPPVVIPSGSGTGPQFIPGLDKSPIKIGPGRFRRPSIRNGSSVGLGKPLRD